MLFGQCRSDLLLLLTAAHAIIPGADPTGRNDSSAALNTAIRSMCNATAGTAMVDGSAMLLPVARDAVLDLSGGVYRLDAPLAVDSGVRCTGMLRVRGGTLLAGEALGTRGSNHSFLVTVLSYWAGTGVSLEQLVFASNGTGGGLRVDAAHHVHVVDSVFLNFATTGIWGSALLGMGHDLAVDRCRLTECTLSMTQCADIAAKRATAILIEFPDSHFRDSVITCGKAGIVNRAGSNVFRGLHIWPSCTGNAPFGPNNTIGLADESGGGTRITDCYFDNSLLRISGYRGTTVTSSMFNGGSRLELVPSLHPGTPSASDPNCQYWKGAVCSLIVKNNQFLCGTMGCAAINASYEFTQAAHVYIGDNAFERNASTTCTSKAHSCIGVAECAALLTPCDP